MFTFAYKARDVSGKIITGTQDAMDEDNAMTSLMNRGLLVLSIQQKKSKTGGRIVQLKVKSTELVMFTRMLATMIAAGLPLVQSLDALHDQSDPRRQKSLRAIIADIMARVGSGDSFWQSVAKHPGAFSNLYISMVKAGEAAGLLETILDRLATFLESGERLMKKVKSALTYPCAVLTIAFGITTFLIVKVVPVFAEIFAEFGSNLPAPTQFLVDLSKFVRLYWYVVIVILVVVPYSIRAFLRTSAGARLWDQWKLKLPIFGPLIYKIAMTRFARTFAQLLRAGVPILDSLTIVGDTAGNIIVSESMAGVKKSIEKGDSLSSALAKEPIFPPMLLRMVSAGEQTGATDEMLEKIADFWDEEIETTLDALTSLMEPIMLVLIGSIVGGIVIAMFLPIFKLHEVISKN